MNSLITNNHTSNFHNYIIKYLNECKSFTFNVAFINFSGIQLLLDTFKCLEKKGIKGKILTSTYLNFTQVKALEKILEFKNIELRIFDCNETNVGFHSKAYIFEFDNEYKTIIGSSNITASAFKTNIEWNLNILSKIDDDLTKDLFKEFNKLWNDSLYVNKEFLLEYKKFQVNEVKKSFVFKKDVKANYMQEQALSKLEFLRNENQNKALVIAATGSGKTYLAAFDVKNYKAKTILFLVHRENILLSAKSTFENIIKNKTFGLNTGSKKEINVDYLFSTIQTMSSNYNSFAKNAFDYIIVDEAHHITSPSYKKVIDYFKSDFLLGLTATPNRMDKENIYEYFDDNIACDIRLSDALDNSLVVPFHYYGISDIKQVDYDNVDISKISELSKLLMVNKRVEYIIEKMCFYSFSGNKRKALAFCASKEHCYFMEEQFNKKGIKAVSLTSNDSIEAREGKIKELENENSKLEVIFCVDIFNEGVDIPSVNTVLMLRPTNSPIIFIQQLGRGLRKHESKEFLTLLDFIGNHEKAYLVALALVGNKALDKESLKLSLLNNFTNIPNAFISMDKISKDRILKQIDDENFNSMKYLKNEYYEFKSMFGNRIPLLCDYLSYDELISPIKFINESKSYVKFLSKVENDDIYKSTCKDEIFIKAISFIESLLPIKRVYEFVILKYLLENESASINKIATVLHKYLKVVSKDTILHAFRFLNQEYFDKAQVGRYLKLVKIKDNNLYKTNEFRVLLENSEYKKFFEDSLSYGILDYEKKFSIEDYGIPFLKLYEKYNMLNIAQLCNFNKIHSSFRGSGFLKYENDFFLFISIEKDKLSKASKYKNDFISKDTFTYVSKPAHTQEKGDGLKLIKNKDENINLHIFVRKFVQVDKKTQGFVYLGLADTIYYSGNKPIIVHLKLRNELSSLMYEEFTKMV